MALRMRILWAFCICLTLSEQLHAQNAVFPDILKLKDDLNYNSFKILVEANNIIERETIYVTEYYDKIEFSGRLDMEIKGQENKVIYFNKTNEIFFATKVSCKSVKISNIDTNEISKRYGVGWNWVNKDSKNTVIGPSNMLQEAARTFKTNPSIFNQGQSVKVRGMDTNVWLWNFDSKTDVTFYFTDPEKDNPYGLTNVPVPVRVAVQGEKPNPEDKTKLDKYKYSFDIVGLQLDVPEKELKSKISIPVSIGCLRQDETIKQKKTPEFETDNIYLEAEMVYAPYKNNSPSFTYVTNLKMTVDQTALLVAFQFSPWKSHQDAEMAAPGDNLFRVVDISNNILYDIDKTKDTCQVTRFEGDDKYTKITLPDGQSLDLGEQDIFFIGSDDKSNKNFKYLGESETRGIPSSVYEKRVQSDDIIESLDETIVTRYHMAERLTMEGESFVKNAPLQVVYWNITFAADKFLGNVVVNYYAFQKGLPNPSQIFDVRPCFAEDDQSKWVQLILPMDGANPSDVIPQIPFIQDNFVSYLTASMQISPTRIPKILVDVDVDNIYITVLILERPPFLLDFLEDKNMGIKQSANTKTTGISTLADCAKSCLDELVCPFFSYCGANCVLAGGSTNITADIEYRVGCSIYENMFPEDSVQTMGQLSKAISGAVATRSIFVSLFLNKKTKDFTATLFKDDLAFGLEGFFRKPEGTIDDRFNIFATEYKLKSADDVNAFGKLSFGACKQACLNRESCESFSYCLATAECFLSSKHGDEITNDQKEPNTQCMILSRAYQDHYQRFPGISIAHSGEKMLNETSIEGCAKACFKEGSFPCQSFDFCGEAAANGDQPCMLHKEHVSDITETEHVKVTEKCGHYSRKYVYEFKMDRHKLTKNTQAGAVIQNVNAEQCAKLCRENQGFACVAFDLCSTANFASTNCTLRKETTRDFVDSELCNSYSRTDIKLRERRSIEGHSKSLTGGLGFMMLLIGIVIGCGAIFGYGYYKTNRNR